jgi:hypothetical protein
MTDYRQIIRQRMGTTARSPDMSVVDDVIFRLDTWGVEFLSDKDAQRERATDSTGEASIDFFPPFPGKQPIASSIAIGSRGITQATIRYGSLEQRAFDTPRHPTNVPEQIDRIVAAAAAAGPIPGALVLANYGDPGRVPRPHLLIGWRPSMADDSEVVQRGDRSHFSAGPVVDYIQRVGEEYRDEFAAEYATEERS